MLIAVAGPYSADTSEQRQRNLDAMNEAAAAVMMRGHIPVIGVNAALPVVECLRAEANRYEAIMAISLALVNKCEAILMIGESPGANRERDIIKGKGLPVYKDVSEIPLASASESAT
ncbi:MAG: hypothetical protein AUG51_09225 [Acidobacteria bacterium 13_1_20CM_3_53_8]|nr:MAG: hypothetical protein AUG51_09225 [Acidobacteria bacterium 13_1_20CM_3_53_8]